MRFGVVILPESPWAEAQATWRRAEELGFDHAWTYDHIAWGPLRDGPWYSTVATLAAAATATARIRLGPLVASPNFRHPVPFARDLMGLDDISGGRITLGVGAGGRGWDATMLGDTPSPRERADRFSEFVELTDRLLRERRVTHHGRYFTAEDAPSHPGCVQQPRIPFAVAASGPRGMTLAARYADAWVTTGDLARDGVLDAAAGTAIVAEQMARVDEACSREGREPASLARMVVTGPRLDPGLHSVEAFRATAGRYAELGITDLVVHWPRPEPPYAADLTLFERIFS